MWSGSLHSCGLVVYTSWSYGSDVWPGVQGVDIVNRFLRSYEANKSEYCLLHSLVPVLCLHILCTGVFFVLVVMAEL